MNAFPRPAGGPSIGKDIQVHLDLVASVSHTAWGANAWIDFHVFDGDDVLIHAETLTLAYTGWGPIQQYGFAGKIYQGPTATPGSVSPRPDARKVQYRLYYEIDGQVFTDGILHQAEVPEDALIRAAHSSHVMRGQDRTTPPREPPVHAPGPTPAGTRRRGRLPGITAQPAGTM
ncbi:hypothetical protein [Sorangium sp. So ce117]|uniref:hypothetical protein n=1 Tax=Sorangium sp. So ce117 TaxID=3133277 RepID=UPI003F625ECB